MIEASARCGSGSYGGYYYLAQVLYASRRLEEAEEAVARAREFQPTRPGVIDLATNIARKLGRLKEALELNRAHLKLDPSSESSQARLQELQAEMKQVQARAAGRPEAIKTLLGQAAVRRRRARS